MQGEQHNPGNYLSIGMVASYNLQALRLIDLRLDGGPSGLPALYILMEAFSRLQSDLNSDNELEPCRWFNLINGTGRGA